MRNCIKLIESFALRLVTPQEIHQRSPTKKSTKTKVGQMGTK